INDNKPLILACAYGNTEAVQYILNNIKYDQKLVNRALLKSKINCHPEVIDILTSYQLDVTLSDVAANVVNKSESIQKEELPLQNSL
ncbi:MAG: ankyrin repeat domain-containing protein, partial [Endozoicomonadaceae bacterium]|nr:ankyrin repeat domain-containing protein [Endozoicomonadaceae bacterium]